MSLIEHNAVVYEVNDNFFLVNFPNELDENWIDFVQGAEDMQEISPEQRELVTKIREHYEQNGRPPKMKDVARITGYPLKRLYSIFPNGPATIAKMAGLPNKIC